MTRRALAFAAVLALPTVVVGTPAGAQPPYTPSAGCAQAGGTGPACAEVGGVTVTRADGLALTGSQTTTIAVIGAGLVTAGALLVTGARRRREQPEPIWV